jgi:preprotein translocase subunit YajC
MSLTNLLIGISTALAEEATTTDTAATGSTLSNVVSMLVSLLPMVLIFVVFYFFLIRPQKKKDKQVQDMLNALKVHDRVCTIGGIYGTITAIKDDTVTLSVGKDHVNLVFARWAIRSVEEVAVENDSEALN